MNKEKYYCIICNKTTKENICCCEECETQLNNEQTNFTSEEWIFNEFEKTEIQEKNRRAYLKLINTQNIDLDIQIQKIKMRLENE